jgi:GcrA cell cycle regulator
MRAEEAAREIAEATPTLHRSRLRRASSRRPAHRWPCASPNRSPSPQGRHSARDESSRTRIALLRNQRARPPPRMTECKARARQPQIAREIGVTRNAVIGKMNRLGLSRPKDVIGRQLEQRRAARLARPKTARAWRPKHPRLNIFARHEMLAAFPRPQPRAEDTRMHAVRAQPEEVPLANQQPRRRLLLLWERASQRTTLLPGARAHRVSVGRSTAQQRRCVSDDTTAAAPPSSVMNVRRFIRSPRRHVRARSAEFRGALAVFKKSTDDPVLAAAHVSEMPPNADSLPLSLPPPTPMRFR